MTITFKDIESTIKDFPNSWVAKNSKAFNINLADFADKPQLLERLYFYLSEKPTKNTQANINMVQQAWSELESSGFFNQRIESSYQKFLEAFRKSVQDEPTKISMEDLEEVFTVKTKKGVKSLQVEYNDFMDLLDNAYNIDNRDFFGKYSKLGKQYQNELFKRFLNATPQEIKKAENLAPSKSLLATKMSFIITKVLDENFYYDFWHQLLEADFSEVSNGSVQYMFPYEKDSFLEGHGIADDEEDVSETAFRLIKECVFKELKPYFDKHGITDYDSIEFYVWW